MYNQELLHDIAKPFVIAGIHKDEKSALTDIIIDFVQRKIRNYESTIQDLENKHSCDFEQFSIMLREKADLAMEDDWFDWKAAEEMRQAWKDVNRMIMDNV